MFRNRMRFLSLVPLTHLLYISDSLLDSPVWQSLISQFLFFRWWMDVCVVRCFSVLVALLLLFL